MINIPELPNTPCNSLKTVSIYLTILAVSMFTIRMVKRMNRKQSKIITSTVFQNSKTGNHRLSKVAPSTWREGGGAGCYF